MYKNINILFYTIMLSLPSISNAYSVPNHDLITHSTIELLKQCGFDEDDSILKNEKNINITQLSLLEKLRSCHCHVVNQP